MILNRKDSFEVAMRDLLLAVLLTGISFHVVGCQGPHGGDATRSREAITYYDRGVALHKRGELDGAIAEYRAALRLNPNDVDAHYNLQIALQKLGSKAEAREEFTEVQQLLPDTPPDQKKIELVRQRLRELE
jgi:tetratricopeptide (TPR) repeat protein